MRKLILLLLACGWVGSLSAQLIGHWESRSPMPTKRANMATASIAIGDTTWIYTFMGIDSTKACGSGIRLESYKYNTVTDVWSVIAPVPDTQGRLAASAHGIDGKVYLVGGYKVYSSCGEFTSPRVDIYDPITDSWSLGDSMAVPVDDHVQVNYKDSLLILVSGWSGSTNVRNVQVYDIGLDTWSQSNLVPGPGLFGHCGALVEDTLMYMDGVRIQGFNFVLINQVNKGVIDPTDFSNITWTAVGMHPGDKVYRGGGFSYGDRALFTGGTNNAYNIDGIGYNNQPSVESGRTFGYHFPTGNWEEYTHNPDSVMDVRQIVPVGEDQFYVVGGMSANQAVTNSVSVFVVDTATVGTDLSLEDGFDLEMALSNIGNAHQIQLDLHTVDQVDLQIVDLTGRLIATRRIDGFGRHQFPLAEWLPGLTSGTYALVAAGDTEQKALKFVVWK